MQMTYQDMTNRWYYHIETVVREESQYIAYVAYLLDLFEEDFVTNMFISMWVMYLVSKSYELYI